MIKLLPALRYILHLSILTFLLILMAFFFQPQNTGVDAKEGNTLLGNYLAGRFATAQRDNHTAAEYYRQALKKDASNKLLLEQSFLLEINAGNWRHVSSLAKQLVKFEPNHYTARLFLGTQALKRRQYRAAKEHFSRSGQGAVPELTTELALAWTNFAQNNTKKALANITVNQDKNWLNLYRRYHRALIADLSKNSKLASVDYKYISKKSPNDFRTTLAHVRHALKQGEFMQAKKVLDKFSTFVQGTIHPNIEELYGYTKNKQNTHPIVQNAKEGLAEVFYGLGDALSSDGGVDYGAIYLKLALYLKPDMESVHVVLANIYERTKKYDLAIKTYKNITENSPLWPRAQLRKALNYNYMDKVDEATALLKNLIKARPDDIQPVETLGNILRVRKRYEEALVYYDKAVKFVQDNPTKKNWVQFYHRGVSYERLNQWKKAETDLNTALKLDPNQALVLNYLGYSWVDQNYNLDKAINLIRRAVQLKPNDGYIVDSLGWAYYRLGDYKSAVKYLEKAVYLKPDDSVINDHLGDAYWYVGRRTEAKYQWSQALSLKPEKKEIATIEAKLREGLPDVKQTDQARLKGKKKPVLKE
ncbi:MAG: tetratricopeptide repeat protein [Pseudomonadota bacterium]